MAEVVVDRLELVQVDEQHRHHAVAAVPIQSRERLTRTVHQQQPVGQTCKRIVQGLALQPHAVSYVLGRRVPGVTVAARAPQQPAPRAVSVAVAGCEILDLIRLAAVLTHHSQRLLHVVRMHELPDRSSAQLLARPAQQLLPRGVQQREATVERDRRQQVAGHLEQARDTCLAVERRCDARVGLGARRVGSHPRQSRRLWRRACPDRAPGNGRIGQDRSQIPGPAFGSVAWF